VKIITKDTNTAVHYLHALLHVKIIISQIDKIPRIQGRNERSLEKFATSPDGSTIAFVGNDGYIILVDVQSKSRIALFKMNGSCRAVTFTPDGENIISSGSDGDVYM